MDGVAFAEAIVDCDGLVDKGADAIAHLAAHALESDAGVLVDDGDAHADVGTLVDVAQCAGWACCDAGEVLAEAAGLRTCIDDRRAHSHAHVAAGGPDGEVGAGLHACAALDAVRREIRFSVCSGGPQQEGLAARCAVCGLEHDHCCRCACYDARYPHALLLVEMNHAPAGALRLSGYARGRRRQNPS